MNEIKLNKDFLVTVHNDLVQARFSDSLTINEQKILFAVLSNIEPPEFEVNEKGERIIKDPVTEVAPFQVPIKEFSEWLGFKDPNYAFFKNTVKKLMRKLVEIKQDDGSWEVFQWVTKSSYIAKEGLAEIKLSPELYPYLLNLEKNFTTIRLSVLLNFKSVYSARLYQLIKKWSKIKTWKVEVEELKNLLGVPIVKEENGKKQFKLALYGHFKSRALETALKEINEYSEFQVEMIEHKSVRKVTSLSFLIKNKDMQRKNLENPPETPTEGSNNEIEDNTPKNQKALEPYGKSFLERYKETDKKYYDRETNESMLFDGRDRIKVIILNNKFSGIGSDCCYAIEEQLMKIIHISIPGMKLSRLISQLFSYTRNADTINKPEAFIMSNIKKIVEAMLKGNTDITLESIINMKKSVRYEILPDWYFEGEISKKEFERKKEIKFELTRLGRTNITLSDVQYFQLMEKLDREFDTGETKNNYEEYQSLKESGILDKLIQDKKDELRKLNYVNEKGEVSDEIIESIYLNELKRSA